MLFVESISNSDEALAASLRSAPAAALGVEVAFFRVFSFLQGVGDVAPRPVQLLFFFFLRGTWFAVLFVMFVCVIFLLFMKLCFCAALGRKRRRSLGDVDYETGDARKSATTRPMCGICAKIVSMTAATCSGRDCVAPLWYVMPQPHWARADSAFFFFFFFGRCHAAQRALARP